MAVSIGWSRVEHLKFELFFNRKGVCVCMRVWAVHVYMCV